jgi:ubiquinone/menaquinone biosynthesis C-methylase UbiE
MALRCSISDTAFESYRGARIEHWDGVCRQMDRWAGWGGYYHRRLADVYRFLVPSGQRVLEIGCGRGDLLASVNPSYGVGIDFSSEMIKRARQRHPELCFIEADAHDLSFLTEKFDFIILSDLINDLWDVQTVFEQVARLSTRWHR